MVGQHFQHRDEEIIARYTDQPQRLPPELRRLIEATWGGDPVQLYALADLDESLRLCETWVALGPRQLGFARHTEAGWEVESVERAEVRDVQDGLGLSSTTLTFLGEAGGPALARVRYTHRQRRAMENIKFVVEEGLAGRAVVSEDADHTYADGVAGPIKEAQALVAGNRMAVIWRLLSYLRPYRKQVYAGMAAAAVITLVSLVPPFLAGYLIDRIVRPVQDGAMSLTEGSAIAWLAVAAMAVVYLVKQGAALVRLRKMSVLGEWVARDLRTELYEHLQKLSLGFYSRNKTGSLITRMYRPAVGVPGLRRRRRVVVARDVDRTGGCADQPRLAARARDGAAGAGVLLGDLPVRRADQPLVSARLAEMVARP
jgi:ATP-binding cassette subfamily B protein